MGEIRPNRLSIYTIILVSFFIELAVFDRFKLFGVRPEVLLVCTMFFGFHLGVIGGLEAGFISGLLKDILSATNFGINIFLFLSIGLVSGYLKSRLIKNSFIIQFLFSFLCVYIVSGIYFLYFDKLAKLDIGMEFWKMALYKAFYTALIAPGVLLLLGKIFRTKDIEEL